MFQNFFPYYKQAKEHRLDFLKKSFNMLWRLDTKFLTNNQYLSVMRLWLILKKCNLHYVLSQKINIYYLLNKK